MPMELVIHGVGDGAEERDYEATIRAIIDHDPRISIAPPLSRSDLPEALIRADALAVPSRWLETGPLVVLEAKVAGVPILGSRLGGIAELVREPDDGLLVAPDDVDAWANAIARMMRAPRLRDPGRVPAKVRTMHDVAVDMSRLYRELCAAPARPEALVCASR
jgi:glycosyltransferase involved in cell wall biosynthesis